MRRRGVGRYTVPSGLSNRARAKPRNPEGERVERRPVAPVAPAKACSTCTRARRCSPSPPAPAPVAVGSQAKMREARWHAPPAGGALTSADAGGRPRDDQLPLRTGGGATSDGMWIGRERPAIRRLATVPHLGITPARRRGCLAASFRDHVKFGRLQMLTLGPLGNRAPARHRLWIGP